LSALASDHVPDFAFEPPDAAAIQSDGNVSVAMIVPVSAAAQFAGAEPERIRITGAVEIVVSI